MQPFVSIIMPAYNCEQYISQAIDSILNQTYTHFELLIADDCSIDSTKQIIDSYQDERIRKHHNIENIGYLKASNKLVSYAKGNFITFQDADDYCTSDRIEKLLKEFKLDENLYCVGSNVYRVDVDNNIIDQIKLKTTHVDIINDLPNNFNCVGSALMVKKEVVQKLGLYNVFFDRIGSEDLYWFGLVVYNYKVKSIEDCLYYYRQTPNSISNQNNVSPKKLISIEFVKYFLKFYKENHEEIFAHKKKMASLNHFLLGKANCWQGNYKVGVNYLIKSLLLHPFMYTENYQLLKIYLPKCFSK